MNPRQDHIISLLEKELKERRERNRAYSIRSFARDIGIEQSALTRILNRQRVVSDKAFSTIAKNLKFTVEELDLIPVSRIDDERDFKSLGIDKFLAASDWLYDAVLELTRVETFQPSIEWVARKFGVSPSHARSTVDRLERLDLLDTQSQPWKDLSGDNQILADQITHEALKKYQKNILEVSMEALETVDAKERSHTSIIFAGDEAKLQEAKARIHAFRKELSAFLGDVDPLNNLNQVYCLHVGLVPLTKQEKEVANENA